MGYHKYLLIELCWDVVGVDECLTSVQPLTDLTQLSWKGSIKQPLPMTDLKDSDFKTWGRLIEKALQIDLNGKQFVFVHQKGKVEKREVKTNATINGHVLVSGKLNAGEEVVVAGQQKLTEGTVVNVIR